MTKPMIFQELATKAHHMATKAHHMEVTIASRHGNSSYPTKSKKEKVKFKKNVKFSKNMTKEAMSTSTSQPIRITGKPKLEDKKSPQFKDSTKKRPMLKELQEKKFLFSNSDLSGMLNDLCQNM